MFGGNIEKYLERFKNITLPDEAVRKAVVGAILAEMNINIEFKDVSIKNHVAYVKGDPTTRSELFLNKKRILSKLKTVADGENIIDIR